MQVKWTHVRVLVADYPKSFRFYRDVLGLKPHLSDEEHQYAEFETGEIRLALFSRDQMASALREGHDYYDSAGFERPILIFQVEDLDAAYAELERRGASFVAEAEDRPEWTVRTAHFRDPDGNIIEINSPLKAAGGEG